MGWVDDGGTDKIPWEGDRREMKHLLFFCHFPVSIPAVGGRGDWGTDVWVERD